MNKLSAISQREVIQKLNADIRASVGTVNGILTPVSGNPNVQQFGFFNVGGSLRRFPTVRLDANLGKNHHLENITNYQQFANVVDFLNSADPVFPGFPNHGSQDSKPTTSPPCHQRHTGAVRTVPLGRNA